MRLCFFALFLGLFVGLTAVTAPVQAGETVAKVWSGHSVGFALLTGPDRIYAGYYDQDRRLTIAARAKSGGPWSYKALDTQVGWDSHNDIAMSLDSVGRLHVAANMHNVPLIYFMSLPDGDITTLQQVHALVTPELERSVTYPVFLKDKAGRLIFKYRDGGSGRGNEIYNVFDAQSVTWSHLLATPLINGEGVRNAYAVGPVLGPDGWFHMTWVWRDTPMADTNHDLSYAKSPDLIHWFTSDGQLLELPIVFATAETVDPVPVKGGMINNNTVIGFDDRGRVMITYHKYDAAGQTQVYVARRRTEGWQVAQVSRWTGYRWDFGGSGSLDFELSVKGVESAGDGLLKVPVTRLGQTIELLIRSDDLSFVKEQPVTSLAERLRPQVSVPAGMMLNVAESEGYALAWATNPPNRDRPYDVVPPPTDLVLVKLRAH